MPSATWQCERWSARADQAIYFVGDFVKAYHMLYCCKNAQKRYVALLQKRNTPSAALGEVRARPADDARQCCCHPRPVDRLMQWMPASGRARSRRAAIIEALVARLRAEGCKRLWLTTTNDKLSALWFYLRRDFRLMQVRPGAVDAARKLKPTIPLIGEHGIPMREEVDLCRVLDASTVETSSALPPWSRVA
jgi:hypothetical protein